MPTTRILLVVLAVGIGVYLAGRGTMRARQPQAMSSMPAASRTIPAVKGWYKGQEISFIHTEASDQEVGALLTMMMRSPVIFVPSLNQAPSSAVSEVFVFTNGVAGGGPTGFQPDVFSAAPEDAGYSPLRALRLVSWREDGQARELKSIEDIKTAEAKGELTITSKNVVINMPFLTWPGGQR